MKLDSRIIEGKKPLTCFDSEEARQFIGQRGYFSHYIDNYADLKNTVLGTLGSTGDTFHESFCCTEEPNDNYYYEFFIPAEWVNSEEPKIKWRAFKDHAEYKEFLNDGIIESWVKIREKETKDTFEVMYVGGGEDIIYLGGRAFSLSYLFEQYELFNECAREWQPFGVEDKE